jgi:hypothetical protein
MRFTWYILLHQVARRCVGYRASRAQLDMMLWLEGLRVRLRAIQTLGGSLIRAHVISSDVPSALYGRATNVLLFTSHNVLRIIYPRTCHR